MKTGRGIFWVSLSAVMFLFAAEVGAQGMPHPMRQRGPGGPGGFGPGMGPEGGAQRMVPDSRPAQFAPDQQGQPQGRRMTPEERRQLRRDVHDAGRDIYPERMRERRRGDMRPPPR